MATSPELEWEELKNGILLKAAEDAHFDLMVTADQNLRYQRISKAAKSPSSFWAQMTGLLFVST